MFYWLSSVRVVMLCLCVRLLLCFVSGCMLCECCVSVGVFVGCVACVCWLVCVWCVCVRWLCVVCVRCACCLFVWLFV